MPLRTGNRKRVALPVFDWSRATNRWMETAPICGWRTAPVHCAVVAPRSRHVTAPAILATIQRANFNRNWSLASTPSDYRGARVNRLVDWLLTSSKGPRASSFAARSSISLHVVG
jgi:hypothetical protein